MRRTQELVSVPLSAYSAKLLAVNARGATNGQAAGALLSLSRWNWLRISDAIGRVHELAQHDTGTDVPVRLRFDNKGMLRLITKGHGHRT